MQCASVNPRWRSTISPIQKFCNFRQRVIEQFMVPTHASQQFWFKCGAARCSWHLVGRRLSNWTIGCYAGVTFAFLRLVPRASGWAMPYTKKTSLPFRFKCATTCCSWRLTGRLVSNWTTGGDTAPTFAFLRLPYGFTVAEDVLLRCYVSREVRHVTFAWGRSCAVGNDTADH